ncbi:unnamed protein product [Darwinula stevensoni]|uniref:Protein BCCIP homolog n=1 Tax=Darwinula stevensoni TaxID=69355 RepID=A0A7R8WZH4_9CRUS|nr:unnamed protein product [Darwinula stevensoni]CAG0880155.1 unnamed protein product [Darwinula stevensoni]
MNDEGMEGDASSGSDLEEEGDATAPVDRVQVDFEARNILDSDHDSIKMLLGQIFPKSTVDLGLVTNVLLSQNYVGSTIKQSLPEDMEDDEDEGDDATFGVTSILNLTNDQGNEGLKQLKSFLLSKSAENASDQTRTLLKKSLSNEAAPVGWIINERFINIPAQISVPFFESLMKELQNAKSRKLLSSFAYYLFICKLYKQNLTTGMSKKQKKTKAQGEPVNLVWSNPEEEIIHSYAVGSFDYSVETEKDSALQGKWSEDDDELIPLRRLLLLPSLSKVNTRQSDYKFKGEMDVVARQATVSHENAQFLEMKQEKIAPQSSHARRAGTLGEVSNVFDNKGPDSTGEGSSPIMKNPNVLNAIPNNELKKTPTQVMKPKEFESQPSQDTLLKSEMDEFSKSDEISNLDIGVCPSPSQIEDCKSWDYEVFVGESAKDWDAFLKPWEYFCIASPKLSPTKTDYLDDNCPLPELNTYVQNEYFFEEEALLPTPDLDF